MRLFYRRPGTVGAGGDKQDETYVSDLSDAVRSAVESGIRDGLSNRQDRGAVRAAADAHVGHLLSDRAGVVEVRQHTRAHGNRADVQRERLQRR